MIGTQKGTLIVTTTHMIIAVDAFVSLAATVV